MTYTSVGLILMNSGCCIHHLDQFVLRNGQAQLAGTTSVRRESTIKNGGQEQLINDFYLSTLYMKADRGMYGVWSGWTTDGRVLTQHSHLYGYVAQGIDHQQNLY